MRRPELVSPAGDLKKLRYAFAFGADAVYIGGEEFSLRVRAKNFSREDMEEGVSFAHSIGKKVYVTLNAYLKNDELDRVRDYLGFLQDIKVDAVIVSDPGVIWMANREFPGLALHLSTQQNVTNYLAARFYKEQGISRIVLARETSLIDIEKIKETLSDLEIEVFIHGAMCIAYSGRCLLSEYFLRRSANRGDCAQSCRWMYYLMEEKRPGEYLPVFEDKRGTYILSSKDLMTLPILKRLIDAGIESFKIEGRVKSLHYVSTVTYVYRKAIDAILRGEEIPDTLYKELEKISHREYWTGFFDPPEKFTTTYKSMLRSQAEFTGEVEDVGGREDSSSLLPFSRGGSKSLLLPLRRGGWEGLGAPNYHPPLNPLPNREGRSIGESLPVKEERSIGEPLSNKEERSMGKSFSNQGEENRGASLTREERSEGVSLTRERLGPYTYIRVKNRMKIGDSLEFLTPDGIVPYVPPGYFEKLEEGSWVKKDVVHPNDLIRIKANISPYSLMRRLKI